MSGRIELFDVTTRRIPRSIWWRFAVSLSWRRGDFEDGNGYMYGGCLYRWGERIGPVNVAVMRLR